MNTVDLVIKSAITFYDELKADEHGRYRSWEYCYKCFHDARKHLMAGDLQYPQMKLLDMGFWQIAYENDMYRR